MPSDHQTQKLRPAITYCVTQIYATQNAIAVAIAYYIPLASLEHNNYINFFRSIKYES